MMKQYHKITQTCTAASGSGAPSVRVCIRAIESASTVGPRLADSPPFSASATKSLPLPVLEHGPERRHFARQNQGAVLPELHRRNSDSVNPDEVLQNRDSTQTHHRCAQSYRNRHISLCNEPSP